MDPGLERVSTVEFTMRSTSLGIVLGAFLVVAGTGGNSNAEAPDRATPARRSGITARRPG